MSTDLDVPTLKQFFRRASHASVVLGNTVYIDGGVVVVPIEGKPHLLQIVVASALLITNASTDNATLTIDLSKSWTNDSVSFGKINKTASGAPFLNNAILFPGTDNESFFQYGGESNYLNNPWQPPPKSVWQFSLAAKNNGSWSEFLSGRNSGFADITRPAKSLAAILKDTFFMLGGIQTSHSSFKSINIGIHTIPLPGILSYNMTTGIWSNSSMPSHLVRPDGLNGILESVPTFGPEGLLLAAGTGTLNNAPPLFDNITIYEPNTQTWHNQIATGNIPLGRDGLCSVGIQGDNGTYEIFIYGGRIDQNDGDLSPQQMEQNKELDDVYVLSLPAFAWFRADYQQKSSRFLHTCHVVGDRQMLSIWGLDPVDTNSKTFSKDSAAQGLQIFDLTDMAWKTEYDAKAGPYKTPQVVKDWYQQKRATCILGIYSANIPCSGTSSVTWNDPDLQSYFSAGLSASASPPTSTNPNRNHVGAIAGGVIGGIAVLCLLATLAYWLVLRRRVRRQPTNESHSESQSDLQLKEVDLSRSTGPEMSDDDTRYEADGGHAAWEADGHSRVELDSGQHRPELASPVIP